MNTMRLVALNDTLVALDDECIVDIFTTGLGAYCGSFTIPHTNARDTKLKLALLEIAMARNERRFVIREKRIKP